MYIENCLSKCIYKNAFKIPKKVVFQFCNSVSDFKDVKTLLFFLSVMSQNIEFSNDIERYLHKYLHIFSFNEF